MTERIIDGELRLAREKEMAQVTANIYDSTTRAGGCSAPRGSGPPAKSGMRTSFESEEEAGEWFSIYKKAVLSETEQLFLRHSFSPSTMR